jgi:predicted acetyltransferase
MRWVGEADFDRVALTRARCYGSASKDLPRYQEGIPADRRAKDGDFLLAEQNGQPVGTATCLSLSMWVRGGRVPCQGVAWVGTIKTHRRNLRAPGGGVASQIMREALRRAREHEQVVSALMPFRGSYYEHFGYGIVERRCTWTVPLAVLPAGSFEGVGFLEMSDADALAACRQRIVARGQCDIERSEGGWGVYLKKWEDGLVAVDRLADGSIGGYLAFQHMQINEKDVVNVTEVGYEDFDGLQRLLHFLASLRDQYTFAAITLPADLPLNWMLREVQLPHRLVNHPHADVRLFTRMQVRVLDHKRLIEAMHLPDGRAGKVIVAVKECEGHESRFAIDYSAGRASAATTEASPQFECASHVWAAIVCGDMKATIALKLGLATATHPVAAEALDVLAEGPVPFCQEYF